MNQLLAAYVEMPEATLLGLINRDYESLLKIQKKIRGMWIESKKCPCIYSRQAVNKKIVLSCEHIEKEIELRSRKIKEKIKIKSDVLAYRSLGCLQGIQKRLH